MQDRCFPPLHLDDVDRRIIRATQAGLPLVARPFAAVGEAVGIAEAEVLRRIRRMMDHRAIRRIAAVPNHYALGFRANGMSVWDVPDPDIRVAGTQVGGLPYVSHCYHRPRHLPVWPYSLYAMVHGRTRDEVLDHVSGISELLGNRSRGHKVLFSTRILKKTGLRIAA